MKKIIKIKVVGVGGYGGDLISHILKYNLRGVDFIHIDAERGRLDKSAAPIKLLIGKVGLVLDGFDPEANKQAAEESFHEICEVLQGVDIVILMYKLGCDLSSAAGPIIAKAVQSVGAVKQ